MILFRPEHIEPILAGRKTQTRRIWKKPRAKVGSIHLAKTKMISKEYFARLKILAVYQERLGAISDEDARAEGYADRDSYLEAFYRINKVPESMRRAVLWAYVYVVKFEVTET